MTLPDTKATKRERGATRKREASSWVSSITARLVLLAILLVSLTALAVGASAFAAARAALEREARAQLTLRARTAADQFHDEISARIDDTRYWAGLEVMRAILHRDVDKQLAEFLRSTLASSSIYRAIACYDASGETVASAGPPDEAPLIAAIGKEQITTGPASAAPSGSSSPTLLRLQTPIAHPDDPTTWIGTLVLAVESGPAILRRLERQSQSPGTFATAILTDDGVVLARSEPGGSLDPMLNDENDLVARMNVRRLDVRGAPRFVAVAATSAERAFAAVRAMRSSLVTTGIWAVIAGSAIGILFAWGISHPIRRLTAYIQSVETSGSLDSPDQVPSGPGEVGILADAFSTMMTTVSDAHARSIEQSRLALLGEVAGNIAHEIRTPLSVLKTCAELISRPVTTPAERERLSALAVAEVERLNRVVTDLVDIGRPRVPKYVVTRSADIVSRAISFFQVVSDRDGIELIVEITDHEASVRTDIDQIHQVLLNVIRNATQALTAGGTVRVTHRRDDDSVIIEVIDDGPGIAPDLIPKLFSPFVTTKKDGTGLGLAISKRFVEEHGGKITIANTEEGGARVTLRLPIVATAAGRAAAREVS